MSRWTTQPKRPPQLGARKIRENWFLAVFVAFAMAACIGGPARAESGRQRPGGEVTGETTDAAPFVPGFDRFARHGQISAHTGGRLLISELSCTACHASPDAALAPKGGPDLKGVASRLNQPWLRRFLTSPATTKPGTTMPNCFTGMSDQERDQALTALLAYLSTKQQAFPEIRATGANPVPFQFWKKGNAAHGEQLYHQIGCVACHAADADHEVASIKTSEFDQMLEQLSDEELEELGFTSAARPVRSVPLPNLAAKYSSLSLTHFLLAPETVRHGGRMPNFQLEAVEAADIAAYLLAGEREAGHAFPTENDAELISTGEKLFTELGCIQCHADEQEVSAPPATPLDQLDWSAPARCDQIGPGRQPYFPLDAAQTKAIQEATAADATVPADAIESVHFRMLQLNCFACHQRDELGGVGRERRAYFETVGHIDLGDEGRLPPPLTGVGRKLTTSSLQRVLQGDGALRTHMQIRMPKFANATVAPLPDWLAAADMLPGEQKLTEQEVFPIASGTAANRWAEAGRKLLDSGCVQCHPVQGEALPGVVGVDLGNAAQRVRPAWFHDFILDPGSLKPRTRMPTFFPDGESQDPSLLDGKVEKQIAALWHYLKRSDSLPLPEKIREARSRDYELKPTTEPLLLRTFMPQAGTHAIAVGFPQSVHYAFDAETNRLALLWRGGFIDAQGTWFVRFAPPADPLGKPTLLPDGFPFARLDDSASDIVWPGDQNRSATFGGYRIDQEGVPTLLYRWEGWQIEDRIVPDEKHGMRRKLTLRLAANASSRAGAKNGLWFRAHAGKQLKATDDTARTDAQGLTVHLPARWADQAVDYRSNDADELHAQWRIPLFQREAASGHPSNDTAIEIEVRYSW